MAKKNEQTSVYRNNNSELEIMNFLINCKKIDITGDIKQQLQSNLIKQFSPYIRKLDEGVKKLVKEFPNVRNVRAALQWISTDYEGSCIVATVTAHSDETEFEKQMAVKRAAELEAQMAKNAETSAVSDERRERRLLSTLAKKYGKKVV